MSNKILLKSKNKRFFKLQKKQTEYNEFLHSCIILAHHLQICNIMIQQSSTMLCKYLVVGIILTIYIHTFPLYRECLVFVQNTKKKRKQIKLFI